jgi:chemotaxis protein CheX
VENTRPEAMDFTGIIGISGPHKGRVYFTAPTVLLKHLLLALGERVVSKNNVIDVVGEVANTVSSNARREFGKDFLISVPVVVEGAPSSIHLPEALRSYVIPVAWKNYHASVVICLQ